MKYTAKLLITILFFIVSFGNVKPVSAAGTYFCQWSATSCGERQNNCTEGDVANCSQFKSIAECNNNQVGAGNSCVDAGEGPGTGGGGTGGTGNPTIEYVYRCLNDTCFACESAASGAPCKTVPDQSVAQCKVVCNVGAAAMIRGNCPFEAVETAIGCVPIGDTTQLAGFFLRWGLGISGAVAILTLAYSSFMIMTSAGDPKRLQTGKELLFSAISGIILLVFSMFVLRIMGINILGLFDAPTT